MKLHSCRHNECAAEDYNLRTAVRGAFYYLNLTIFSPIRSLVAIINDTNEVEPENKSDLAFVPTEKVRLSLPFRNNRGFCWSHTADAH